MYDQLIMATKRMLVRRYGIFANKVRGEEKYLLHFREESGGEFPYPYSIEELITVDTATMRDLPKAQKAVEYAMRPEYIPPLG